MGSTWVAQSVKRPTQVMISQSVSPSPTLGSVLTAESREPASDSLSPSLCPSPAYIKKKKKSKETKTGMYCFLLPFFFFFESLKV